MNELRLGEHTGWLQYARVNTVDSRANELSRGVNVAGCPYGSISARRSSMTMYRTLRRVCGGDTAGWKRTIASARTDIFCEFDLFAWTGQRVALSKDGEF